MGTKSAPTKKAKHPRVAEGAATYSIVTPPTSIADALFTQTQQRVIGLLFGNPDKSYSVSETIASAKTGSGAVQRELAKLASSGLVTIREVGNQRHYQANRDTPVFEELIALIRKTVGIAEPLRHALAGLAAEISLAFVFGSIAKRSDTARSDIDVFIVSDTLSHGEIFAALEPASLELGRPINPTLFTHEELAQRRGEGQAFVSRVIAQPKLWLIGNDNDLAA